MSWLQRKAAVLFMYHWCQFLHIDIEIAVFFKKNLIVSSEFQTREKHAIILLGDQRDANTAP